MGRSTRSLRQRRAAYRSRPTQSSDSIEQLQSVPDCRDAKLLQGLVRQARKDRLVYLILAECRLILPEAQAPQPDHDVHDGRPQSGVAHMVRSGDSDVSRAGVRVLTVN